MGRAWSLASWARKHKFDRAISHNSYSQILAARALRIECVTLMDYEYQPANHLAFRLSSRIIVPVSFPATRLRRYGAASSKVRRYEGTKEDVYLADFDPDPAFARELSRLGVAPENILVLIRPPAHDALYHRFQNTLFDEVLNSLLSNSNVRVVLLPRNELQRVEYSSRATPNLIIPPAPLDGPNLIAASDLVISAGARSIAKPRRWEFPWRVAMQESGPPSMSNWFKKEGFERISTMQDFKELNVERSRPQIPKVDKVIEEVVRLILE
jgi:predicted glycosyltransferase